MLSISGDKINRITNAFYSRYNMQVVRNPSSGKYNVFLDGIEWTNCTIDSTCPGRALCAINTTWSEKAQVCHCYFAMDHIGAQCETVGPYGWTSLILNSVFCAIGALGFFYELYLIFRLVWMKQFSINAVTISTILNSLGLFGCVLQIGGITRFVFDPMIPNEHGRKTDTYRLAIFSISIAFFFSTLAMLNISLVWLEIANNVKRLLPSSSGKMVKKYKTSLILYYSIFLGVMIPAMIWMNQIIMAAMATPGLFFSMTMYMYAAWKIRSILGQSNSSTPSTSQLEKYRPMLIQIKQSAFKISISTGSLIIWIITWTVVGGMNDKPDKYFNILVLSFIWISAIFANLSILHYLRSCIVKKWTKHRVMTENKVSTSPISSRVQ